MLCSIKSTSRDRERERVEKLQSVFIHKHPYTLYIAQFELFSDLRFNVSAFRIQKEC